MSIKQEKYNKARDDLVKAGSRTAAKSHPRHNKDGGIPDRYGQSLLSEARDDFREMDKGHEELKSGMTLAHYNAIHDAAKVMGIENW